MLAESEVYGCRYRKLSCLSTIIIKYIDVIFA